MYPVAFVCIPASLAYGSLMRLAKYKVAQINESGRIADLVHTTTVTLIVFYSS
jgi:hypothetical protein